MSIINSGEEVFRPYARLISMLGDQLITDRVVAIVELIKNSYDADASIVKIRFNNFSGHKKSYQDAHEIPHIEIEDDGDGMTLDAILNDWLKPATPNKLNKKKNEKQYTNKGRLIQGEKGIGRFSIHKLGRQIDIYTKTVKSNEIHLALNFVDFDPEELARLSDTNKTKKVDSSIDDLDSLKSKYKYLDEVKNKWSENDPPEEIKSKGTLIRINDVREHWDKEDLIRLSQTISKLVPPVVPEYKDKMSKDFDIEIYVNGEEYKSKDLTFEDIFSVAPFRMYGKIDTESNLFFHYKSDLRGKNDKINLLRNERDFASIKTRFLVRGRKPNIGEISFSFYAFDLTKKQDFKKDELDFIKNNNVYVYRDGVRVYPFGEKDYDWLELDRLRAVSRAGSYFSYNDLIGFVFISNTENPKLKDATNRQGIMNIDGAFLDFKALLLATVQLMKWESDIDKRKAEIKKRQFLKDTNALLTKTLNDFKRRLDKINDKETLEKALKFMKAAENHVAVMHERMEIVEDLSGLGMAVEKASHDALTVLAKMIVNIRDIKEKIKQNRINNEELLELLADLDDNAKFIHEELQILQPLFRVARKTTRDVSVNDCVEKVIRYFRRDIENHIEIKVQKTKDIIIKTSTGVILQVLINLMDNAIYWLTEKNKDGPKKMLIKIDGDNKQLVFADNGIGIDPEISPYIFQEFFTLKAQGRGLGLYIAREILGRIDAEIKIIERNSEKLLPGANFLITFPRGK